MTYRVELPIFEGPFDLLLHLIKVNEMDICDIPIAEITRKYLEYVQRIQEELDLDVAGDFLVTASRLLSMKARQLLPGEGADEDPAGEDGVNDLADAPFRESPRDFMRQLIAYRKFKDLARQLSRRQIEQARVHYREEPAPVPPPSALPEADPARQPGLDDLLEAFSRVLRYVDQERAEHAVHAERFTVEDKIVRIEEVLRENGRLDATEEFGRCFHKLEMIVTLLAILELARLRRVRVTQDAAFGGISVVAVEPEGADHPAGVPPQAVAD